MSHLSKILGGMSKLLSYPDETTVGAAELLFVVLRDEIPEAASDAAAFGAFAEQHELWELEEAFTRVFDINPTCSLEVGWHLFGEEYARGMFLVRMREELRKYDLSESVELPDHIAHVLAIVTAMPREEADRFVAACVQPAVEKMNAALEGKESPYGHIISCLTAVLRHSWGEPTPVDDKANAPGATEKVDLLRDYPLADVEFGCGSGCGGGTCGSEPTEVVPLQMNFSENSPVTPNSLDGIPGNFGIPGNLGDSRALPITPVNEPEQQTRTSVRKP